MSKDTCCTKMSSEVSERALITVSQLSVLLVLNKEWKHRISKSTKAKSQFTTKLHTLCKGMSFACNDASTAENKKVTRNLFCYNIN